MTRYLKESPNAAAAETPPPTAPPIPEPPRGGETALPWYRDRVGWILVGSGVLVGGFMLHASSLWDDAVAELDAGPRVTIGAGWIGLEGRC